MEIVLEIVCHLIEAVFGEWFAECLLKLIGWSCAIYWVLDLLLG